MDEILKIVENHKKLFRSGITLDIEYRLKALARLKSAIKFYESDIEMALFNDLGKSKFEAFITEIGILYEEINYTMANLRKWAKPKRVKAPFYHHPAKGIILREPFGVVLIMAPWNYPFQLALSPLIPAIAAGNVCIIKPSEYSDNTSKIIEKVISMAFDWDYIKVINGGVDISSSLLDQEFDKIFFTGSVDVGKIVMSAAAKKLIPVTLELGGKSPAIVDATSDILVAAKRIAWGKFTNAGQTCVAPDYVLVERSVYNLFVENLKKAIEIMYSSNPIENIEYPKIISLRHFSRLKEYIDKSKILFGGSSDVKKLKIEPTIIELNSFDDEIMKDEIFGPLLPVIPYDNLDDMFGVLQRFEKPLALYVFTNDKAFEKMVLSSVRFGGGCVNDTIVHVATPYMPFGGVGPSGIGSYHGKFGFDTFTNFKSILKKSQKFEFPLRYPPYNDKVKWIKRIMK